MELEDLLRMHSLDHVQNTSNRATVFTHLDPRRLAECRRLHEAKLLGGHPRSRHRSGRGIARTATRGAAANELTHFHVPTRFLTRSGRKTEAARDHSRGSKPYTKG